MAFETFFWGIHKDRTRSLDLHLQEARPVRVLTSIAVDRAGVSHRAAIGASSWPSDERSIDVAPPTHPPFALHGSAAICGECLIVDRVIRPCHHDLLDHPHPFHTPFSRVGCVRPSNAAGGVSMRWSTCGCMQARTRSSQPAMENPRLVVIPIPLRVRAPSKEQTTTNSQQAPKSAPVVPATKFKPQAKHHFLPVNHVEDSVEVRRASPPDRSTSRNPPDQCSHGR